MRHARIHFAHTAGSPRCARCKISGADTFEQFLFLEPNASDPLNKEAADDLRQNRDGFKKNVRAAMGGGTVKGVTYDRVLK